jgi:HEPN domain-containing protein
MKQTAIEWLREQLINSGLDYPVNEASKIFEQAKEMEKQQIIDAWVDGNDNEPKEVTEDFAEQYYNEQFKNK